MIDYRPEEAPINPTIEDLASYTRRELLRIANALATDSLLLSPLSREPSKPKAGLIVVADGTNWNPGSGYGAYEYTGTVWRRLA